MGKFTEDREIRLINNVIAHEVGHLIASLLLNKIQTEPKAEEIIIFWSECHNKPGGKINYSIKEGSKHWKFPQDLELCYHTILSLYSGCIWEKFFSSIFQKKELEVPEVETCFQSSGSMDAKEIGFINHLHLKMKLNQPFAINNIIKPYVQLLNSIPQEQKIIIYNELKVIATKTQSKIFLAENNLEYKIENDDFVKLKKFIIEEFLNKNEEVINEIIHEIKNLVQLEK